MKKIKIILLIINLSNFKYNNCMASDTDNGILTLIRYVKYIKLNNNLIKACQENNENQLKILIEQDIKDNIFNKSKLLIVATKNNNKEAVKILLKNGIQDERDGYFKTALFYACENRNKAIAKILIKAASKIYDEKNLKKYLSWGDGNDNSPLHIVCQKNYIEIVKLLIDSGANINKINSDGFTPFASTLKYWHRDVLKLLRIKGAKINPALKENIRIAKNAEEYNYIFAQDESKLEQEYRKRGRIR